MVLTAATIVAFLVLLFNFVATVVLPLKFRDDVIFRGNCDQVSRVNSYLHVAINLLATLLLSASNLGMQLLVAPTRKELDVAHSNKLFLDIGVPSFTNLRHISWKRAILWLLLTGTSLPLHFL